MTLARRIREFRYIKGWGPDELAHRADVSRTALYQIECGRTSSPRASTLMKLANALDLPIERLLDEGPAGPGIPTPDDPIESAPLENVPIWNRGGDLDRKFHDLLQSHLGEGLARLVEESHRLLPHRQDRQF